MCRWTESELTCDAFLGGRLRVAQPRHGYRAGVDPVLLAAAVAALPGQTVLELGCGAGVASLCLGLRVPGLRLAGLERCARYAALARRNATRNAIDFEVFDGDLARMPQPLRQRQFDHVMANPPYFDRRRGTAAPDAARETALGEATPLATWLAAAARRVVPGGRVWIIHRAERSVDLAGAAQASGLGSLRLLPLAPRAGRDAGLILLQARKGGRAALRLHMPVVMHDGLGHRRDGDDYAPEIRAVLREGARLTFPD